MGETLNWRERAYLKAWKKLQDYLDSLSKEDRDLLKRLAKEAEIDE